MLHLQFDSTDKNEIRFRNILLSTHKHNDKNKTEEK